ncbi:hypothetical protein OFC18_30900, partial [Escherichia coli]|nr:hypothetical protein [Escherichia coli]
DQLIAFFSGKLPVGDSFHDSPPEVVMKMFCIEANCRYGICQRRAINHFFDDVAIFSDMDVGFMRDAKQIVIVSHNFLISTDQHYGN